MKGNLAVLAILGTFVAGAIWISVWAPGTVGVHHSRAEESWVKYQQKVGDAPWVALDAKVAKAQREYDDALVEIDREYRRAKARGDKGAKKARSAARKQAKATLQAVKDEHKTSMDAMLATGEKLYGQLCAHCHGDDGKGNGEAAEWLTHQPRHLGMAQYRFRSTPPEIAPADSDLYTTIAIGSYGSPMPGFEALIPPGERWALVAYIKNFYEGWAKPDSRRAKRWRKDVMSVESVLGPRPDNLRAQWKAKPSDPEDAAKYETTGAMIYTKLGNCGSCHGEKGYGDGASAGEQKDTSGETEVLIPPRNFHRPWTFKRGHSVDDIAYTVATGVWGTGMPAHVKFKAEDYGSSVLSREQVWIVSQYVYDMAKRPGSRLRPAFADPGRRLGKPGKTFIIRARAWRFESGERAADPKGTTSVDRHRWTDISEKPLRVAKGETVRIIFQPYDNGNGSRQGQGLALSGYEESVFVKGATVDRPATITFKADKAGSFEFYNPSESAPGHILARMRGLLIVGARGKAEPASSKPAGKDAPAKDGKDAKDN